MTKSGTDLELAGKLLTGGGLVAIPTETVYGLAANALSEEAVLAVFKAKGRPFFDPLIIHVHSLEAVKKYAELDDPRLMALAREFWPGPLTLLLPKKEIIPDIVTSGLPRVAVRIPQHPLTLKLLSQINIPLAAPSANPFGYISPTEPGHVLKQLEHQVQYVLDGGRSTVGIESTIVSIENNMPVIYRLGGLAIEEIEKITGKVQLSINQSGDPRAPGQLKNHYAPSKPLLMGDIQTLLGENSHRRCSVICFGENNLNANHLYNLSPGKDQSEAALNLFKFLRLADDDDSDIVIASYLPADGLGAAINDRLKRASVA